MILLRALFWLAVMSLFVPYKEFDLDKGKIQVDYAALNKQFYAVVHVCETKPDFCEAAGDLAQALRHETMRLAISAGEYAKKHS